MNDEEFKRLQDLFTVKAPIIQAPKEEPRASSALPEVASDAERPVRQRTENNKEKT